MTPYKCPVCEGKKEDYLNCGPCSGTGIIWDITCKITFEPSPNQVTYYPTIDPDWPYNPGTWICGDDLANPNQCDIPYPHPIGTADNKSIYPDKITYTLWN